MSRLAAIALVALVSLWLGCPRVHADQGPRPIQDVEVSVPEGDYALVELRFDVPDAPEGFGQWRYIGGMRDGRLPIDHRMGVRESGGHLQLDGDRLSGTFTRMHGRRNVEEAEVTVQAQVRDGRIEGTARIGRAEGTVTGHITSESELRARNPIPRDTGWPSYVGETGGGHRTGARLIDDPDDIRLLWRTEETDIGQGIGSISRMMDGWRDANGIRTASGSTSPILADGRVYLSYYVPSPPAAEDEPSGPIRRLALGKRLATDADFRAEVSRRAEGDRPAQLRDAAAAMLEEGLVDALPEVPRHAREKVWPAVDDVVLCIDAETGQTLWKAVMKGRGRNLQHHKAGPFNMTAAVGEGRVFAVGMSGWLHAFDASTGEPLWERDLHLSNRTLYSATVQVVEGVLVAPYRNRWAGLDPATGELRWQAFGIDHATLARWSHDGREYLVGGGEGHGVHMISSHMDERIICLDPRTGEELWRIPLPFEQAHLWSGGRGLGHGGITIEGDVLVAHIASLDPEAESRTAHRQSARGHTVAWRLSPEGGERLWAVEDYPHLRGADRSNLPRPVVLHGRWVVLPDHRVADLTTGRLRERFHDGVRTSGGFFQVAEDLLLSQRDSSHGQIDMAIWRFDEDGSAILLTADPPGAGSNWRPPFGGQTSSYQGAPMLHAIVDGRMFIRQFDGIYCWDLRKGQ